MKGDVVNQVLASIAKKIRETERIEDIPPGLLEEFGKLALQVRDDGEQQKLERKLAELRQDFDFLTSNLENLGIIVAQKGE